MKLLLVFILFPLLASAQLNEPFIWGGWVKTKVEMKDGSRVIDRVGARTGHLIYGFGNDGSVFFGTDPIYGQGHYTYQIKDSTIQIAHGSYQVIKLTRDSLVLQDNTPDLPDSKTTRYYFAKLETHHSDEKPVYNDAIKDSVYQATPFTFPQSVGALNHIEDELSYLMGNGKIKLSFVIDKSGKLTDLKMLENDSLSKSIEKKVMYEFEQQRVFWRPGYINEKPVNVAIEMTVVFEKFHRRSSVAFITPFAPTESPYKSLPLDAINKAQEAFNQGVVLAKKHDYDKALVEFTNCLAIDDLNLDAYYFRATINFETGNKKAACDDWKTLAGLGQVLAEKYLAKYAGN